MRKILIIGAGKSSISLIDYLVEHAGAERWELTVADISTDLALKKTKGRPHTRATSIDIEHESSRKALIATFDIVISMLPAGFHSIIAHDCLDLGKNLVTPSYISPAMKEMDEAVRQRGLIFMNEMGLDPGIDHMSAMQILDRLRAEGREIVSFRSHCGGLVAPDSDDNAWHYKFSWNPRNVVLAGQGDGGIRWKENGEMRHIHYHELFRHTSAIDLGEDGRYESYPNRDSLKYIAEYGLDGIQTIYRGTLRVPPFCEAWDCLVQLGLTSPSGKPVFVPETEAIARLGLAQRPGILHMLEGIGAFEQSNFPAHSSPADSLQKLLEDKWKMRPDDRDLVVMVHEIAYRDVATASPSPPVPGGGSGLRTIRSSLHLQGRDGEHTAMALTVGLPLAIVTRLILNGQISRRGVIMPKYKEIYEPVMRELEGFGLRFKEMNDL